MSEEKLTKDEVPQKFSEWLLAMGCPPEKVPYADKIVQMCRGQYYMAWRSLMEHVQPKESVRCKRLQVFCDDVRRSQVKNVFNELDTNVVVPEELLLLRQHKELKEKVADAEARVAHAQQNLNQLTDKVSSKLSHRNLSCKRVQDAQRRAWLLRQVAEELRNKKANLQETRTVADSLCCVDDDVDVQSKLEKCIACARGQTSQPAPAASLSLLSVPNPVASSSVVSANGETNDTGCGGDGHVVSSAVESCGLQLQFAVDCMVADESVWSLGRCRSDAVWTRAYERHAGLVAALSAVNTHSPTADAESSRTSPQSVLAHTMTLQCTLTLEATKNRIHAKHARKRLANAVTEISSDLTRQACELVVLRCERASAEARVSELQSLLDEMTSRIGVFRVDGEDLSDDRHNTESEIATIDKDIENKRDELNRVSDSLLTTEWRIQNIKQCLTTIFDGFRSDLPVGERDRYIGLGLDLPQEPIASLRQFYEERRNKRKLELSFKLDTSDPSFSESDVNNPRFIDELNICLRKFNLEKNRKLVLESGEKIWIFETLQSLTQNLHIQWQRDDIICSLICPSVTISRNIQKLIDYLEKRSSIKMLLQELNQRRKICSAEDITLQSEEEAHTIDMIKKRLHENILSLQTTSKTLSLGRENLMLWSHNQIKKYISDNRIVEGKSYQEYERYYLESLTLNA